jgi:hypothetical protein
MTIDCTDIESILGPIRPGDSDRVFSPLDLKRPIKWSHTPEEWIGDARHQEDALQRIRVAAVVAFMDHVPKLAAGYPWSILEHEAGGEIHNFLFFVGMRVALKPDIESEFLKIARYWFGKSPWMGDGGPSLSELMEYRSQLQGIGLDCNLPRTYSKFTEAFYPIDLRQDLIDRICLRTFDLESVFGEPKPYAPYMGIERFATFAVLAPNCG